MEQPDGSGGRELPADAVGARRLAGERHVVRVAAEGRRVAVDPAKGGLLVHQPERPRPLQTGETEEAEDAQPVVDRDDDQRPGLGEPPGVDVAARARAEPAAVHPDEHREPRVRARADGHGDVEREAVLGVARGRGVRGAGRGGELGAAGAGDERGPRARPRGGWLRRLPAQLPDRGRGVRDALVAQHRPVDDAEQPALLDPDARVEGRGRRPVRAGAAGDEDGHGQRGGRGSAPWRSRSRISRPSRSGWSPAVTGLPSPVAVRVVRAGLGDGVQTWPGPPRRSCRTPCSPAAAWSRRRRGRTGCRRSSEPEVFAMATVPRG